MLNGKKLVAMILIFTMTFANFAFVTESIATTGLVSLFGSNHGTGNDNVEFEAYLANGDETSDALVSDVNNENLAVKLQLDVKNSGYLKNAKVEVKAEENEELNFGIKEDNNVAEMANVQSLENNTLILNKVDYTTDKMEISIPIAYEAEEYINETKLCNTANVILSGIYVDDNGKEHEISKEIELTLAWKDERAVKVENEVTKYIQFGNDGVILQTMVKVDSSNPDKNTLPTKETEVNIDVPKIKDIAPKEISVIANSTLGTNGKGVGETEFNEENWNYNAEENKINIKVENKKQLVDVSTDEYLKVDEETKQEERYYSIAGVDEYVITYTYQGLTLADEMNTSTKVEAKLTTFSGVEADGKANTITAEKSGEITLTGQTGNLVSYDIENETKDVSKVYTYLNKEVEYTSKTAINVSYKDIVEAIMVEDVQNYYIDKAGNKLEADDLYYKQVSVNKDNFNEILGEDGNIQILDGAGNIIATINKEYTADENGSYVVNFENRIPKIMLQTSAPVNTGNLVVSNKKATVGTSLAKPDYANAEYLATDTIQKAKFSYVSEVTTLGNCTVKTKLNDTTTDFNLMIDRDSLSTVTPNTNVEMRLELKNHEETSDIYGASVFEMEMPEYITALNVTNASMIYGEGLDITGVETYTRDGKVIIKVNVDGKQADLNSGVLTNGANIVLNADITVDKYTPSLDTTVKAYCYNSEATNYANVVEYTIGDSPICSLQEAKIEYSAPSGLVAINTVANYNAVGTSLTSIKQGEQVDYLDIYSEAKNATMEVVAINNNEDAVTDLDILGRIPFQGVKDLTTGEDLGTTLDTKMVSGIVSNEANTGDFTVYYSENKEATRDLDNSENGWVQNPESLENMKSYLIVPNDSNYQMEAKQVLKFTYEYQIPENLDHNEDIYGTFLAYYTSQESGEATNETAKPDLVGLTTGAGPELDMEIKTDKNKVKELEEFTVTATIKNAGADVARDVTAEMPLPANVTYVSAKASRETIHVAYENGKVIAKVGQLGKEDSFDVEVTLKVNAGDESTEIAFIDTVTEFKQTINIEVSTTAIDLEKPLTKGVNLELEMAKLRLTQENVSDLPDHAYQKGEKLEILLHPKNATTGTLKNVRVETVLPKEVTFVKADIIEATEMDGNVQVNYTDATYDSSSHKVTWTIDSLGEGAQKSLELILEIGDISSAGITEDSIIFKSDVSADGTEKYKAEDLVVNLGKESLSVVQTTTTPTYVTEGSTIDYNFSIKNEGATATEVTLTDIVPEGLAVTNMRYSLYGTSNTIGMSEEEQATTSIQIPAKATVDVGVKATALSLNGVKEKTVTNEGTITSSNSEEVKSNSVTHIVQAKETENDTDNKSSETNINNTQTNDITKTHKISGTAWLDANSNGMRDSDEQRMENITAMLVDSASGTIKKTVTTNNSGEYTFAGIQDGSYLVLFKYDTVKYTTTTYKKDGVETSINSDVVTTKIEQDGKKENGAITDVITINGANVGNIDIGLVEAEQFSLSLDKAISKVTVQNAQGTKTEEFDKTKLAKYDIAAKYLSGTTVYVEYTMTVTNNGDLSGFASEIVDYVPEGMTFNSNLNPDWYTGTDGSLYTKALANTELAKGESKEIKLVLTKQMTAENTGLVSNTAEIADDFNIYGVSDNNSVPHNKAQGEDDMSTADTILTVKTGESLIYVSAIIVSAIIGCAVAFIVYERVLKSKRKGGV